MPQSLCCLSQDEDTRREKRRTVERRWRDSVKTIKANTVEDLTASSRKVYEPVWSLLRVEHVVPVTGWS